MRWTSRLCHGARSLDLIKREMEGKRKRKYISSCERLSQVEKCLANLLTSFSLSLSLSHSHTHGLDLLVYLCYHVSSQTLHTLASTVWRSIISCIGITNYDNDSQTVCLIRPECLCAILTDPVC